MIRFIRKLLGLCDTAQGHNYQAGYIWKNQKACPVLRCERCGDVKVRKT